MDGSAGTTNCQRRLRFGGGCGARAIDGHNCCLAHTERDLRLELMRTAAFGGGLDLERTELGNEVLDDLRTVLTEFGARTALNCAKSVFLAKVSFPGFTIGRCDLSGAVFLDEVDFDGCEFQGRVQLTSAQFVEDVSFRRARFLDDVAATGAWFGGHGTFEEAHFERTAHFGELHLWLSVNEYGRPATHESPPHHAKQGSFSAKRAWFGGPVTFAKTNFTGPADLDHATFDGSVSFRGVAIRDRVAVEDETDGEAWWTLEGVRFGGDVGLGSVAAGNTLRTRAIPLRLVAATWTAPAVLDLRESSCRLERCVVHEPLTITSGPPLRERLAYRHPPAETDIGLSNEPEYREIMSDLSRSPYGARLAAIEDCTILAPLTIAGCSLAGTSFLGSTGLDQLRFPTPQVWDRRRGRATRRVIADEKYHQDAPDVVEPLYRQLRAGLEASKAAPAAADFYMGELEARRRQRRSWFDSFVLLPVYRWVGGYGVRALPPALWVAVVVAGTAWAFTLFTDRLVDADDAPAAVTAVDDPSAPPGSTTIVVTPPADPPGGQTAEPEYTVDGYDLQEYPDALAFVLRSSVSLFAAPTGGLQPSGTFVLIAERFAAVSLLALTLFALRSRVTR